MTDVADDGVTTHESNPDEFGQFLLHIYRDSHGTTRTISWRQSPLDTYGPEHILFASPVEGVLHA